MSTAFLFFFMELKNVHKDIRAAYEKNLSDYKDTIPHLFHHNAIIMLANGVDARIGSLSSIYKHFHEWKRLNEAEPGVVNMETLLKGICDKRNFLDIFENFIPQNQQFLGVNRAINSVYERRERQGKLGVFWHTQGAGKSYSIAFFTQKFTANWAGTSLSLYVLIAMTSTTRSIKHLQAADLWTMTKTHAAQKAVNTCSRCWANIKPIYSHSFKNSTRK